MILLTVGSLRFGRFVMNGNDRATQALSKLILYRFGKVVGIDKAEAVVEQNVQVDETIAADGPSP